MTSKKTFIYGSVFLLALALGIFIKLQTQPLVKEEDERDKLLVKQYGELVKANQELEEELEYYRQQLESLKEMDTGDAETVSRDDVEYYKLISGFTDVHGEGISISLSLVDMDQPLNIVDFHRNLLLLVNELNAAGAEAISVKEERMISISEISFAGNHIVINGQKLAPPFTVKALGNADNMEAALNMRRGYVERLRNSGYFIEIKKNTDLMVPKYPHFPRYRYAETLEE